MPARPTQSDALWQVHGWVVLRGRSDYDVQSARPEAGFRHMVNYCTA